MPQLRIERVLLTVVFRNANDRAPLRKKRSYEPHARIRRFPALFLNKRYLLICEIFTLSVW